MASLRQRRIQHLTDKGLTSAEAKSLADKYSYHQLKTLPYIRNLKRDRLLYVNNLRSRGFSPAMIKKYVKALSVKKGWVDKDGEPDAWAMLRNYRKKSIEKGDYKQPPKKSHKKVSDEEMSKQRVRQPRLTERSRSSLQNRLNAINARLQSGKVTYVDQYERLVSEKERIEKRLGR